MAGIIASVAEDIRELQRLREEIARIKKELTGINIKVDIDIKEGLEKQLQSLMSQYNNVAARISEAEGRIILSCQNINKATDKIVQAQEKKALAANSNRATESGNTSAELKTEKENVSSLAKTYDELKDSIDSVLGSRNNNIIRLMQEQAELKKYQEELKKLEKNPTGDNAARRIELTAEIEKSKIAIAELRKILKNEIKLDIAAPNSIDALSQSLSRMKDAYKELSEEERASPLGKELYASIEQADKKIKELSASIGEYQRNVGNYGSSFANIRAEQRALVTELAQLTIQYREMSSAEKESAKGQELKQKIDELTEKAAELKDAMADVNRSISIQSSDTAAFDSISEGINLVVSGFGAATGAAQLLGLSEEDLVAVQTKLQAAFVASNAIVQIQNTLQKESALMQGVYALQARAAATAVTIKTAAEGKGVIVTKAATVAQAAFNAVAKANPYVLLAAALVSVVGALWAFTKGQEEATKAEEKRKEALEKAKKEQEEYNEAIASGASKNISKLEELRRKWVDLGKDMDAQKKFIERNKDEFHSLGIEATNITDVENILINKTTEVKQAFMERAKAAAAAALATEKYQQALEKRLEKEKETPKKLTRVKAGDEGVKMTGNGYSYRMVYDEKSAKEENARQERIEKKAKDERDKMLEKEAKALEEQANKLFDIEFESEKKANETLKKAGVKEYDKDEEQEKEKQKREAEKRKKEAAQLSKQQSEYTALLDKQRDETIKKQRDNSYEIWQNEIDLMEEGNRKTLAQTELDYDRQIAAIEDYEDKLKQEKIAAAKAAFEKNPANKGKVFDADSVDVRLTEQETELIQSMRDKADKEYGKSRQEVYKAELSAMRDYLKEYGTYQQQRLAIAEEYAEKIKKAQTEGERLSLTKERDKALRGSEDAQILNRVDWVTTFGKLGTTFDELIKNALAELNAYMQTDDFKNRPAEEKKAIIEAQGNLQSKVSNDATFEKLNKQIEAYRANVSVLSAAEAVHKAAIEAGTAAEQERDKITDTGCKEYKEANDKVIAAKEEEERTAGLVTTASDAVANAQANVARTATELQANLENFSAGLNQLTSGTLAGTVEGLEKLFSSLGMSDDIMNKFKKTLETGLSALFGDQLGGLLADSLDIVEGFLTGDLSEAIVSAVLGMIDNILDGVLSGDFITKPVTALVNGLGSIANTITFGGFNSWFGGADYSEWNDALAYWGGRLEVWGEAVDRYTQEISKGYGAQSYEAAEKARYYLEQEIKGQEQLLNARLGSGASAGSHSIGYRMWQGSYQGDNGRTWDDVAAEISKRYGKPFTGMSSLYGFSADELREIAADYVDLWTAMDTDFRNGLEDLIEMKEQAEEIEDALKESLTGVSFDSFKSGFFSALADMETGVDDLTEDFEEKLHQSILNSLLDKDFNKRLEKLYNDWAGIFDDDGNVDEGRVAALKAEEEQLVKDMADRRDLYADIFGMNSSSSSEQTATAKSIQNITQDQVNEIDGRLNATQIAVEQGNELKRQQYEQTSILNAKFDEMMALKRQDTDFANNILDMMANSYLELQEINENTGSSAKSLKSIDSNLSDVKRELKAKL